MAPRSAVALAGALTTAALAVPALAHADVRIDGHGWGHGVGLSQYGAFGYASRENRDFGFIVGHYYPGTRIAGAAPARMRVRLRTGSGQRVSGATLVKAVASGRKVRLSAARSYRITPWSTNGLRVIDLRTNRTRALMRGTIRMSGPAPLRLASRAENGVTNGRYRGALLFSRDQEVRPPAVLAVDDVSLEQYLWGVVPAEMPASWPAAALRAQAVVARSYALRGRRGANAPYDVFTDTRSQMYRGLTGEAASSTAAVNATRRLAVFSGSSIAQTLFFSSSGGRTAAAEEVFTTAPVPYLVPVDDPYDVLSPYHNWSVTLSDPAAAKKLGDALAGDLVDIAVSATTPTGRAARVTVTGTKGAKDVPASLVRTRLGLRSTWFAITHTAPPAS